MWFWFICIGFCGPSMASFVENRAAGHEIKFQGTVANIYWSMVCKGKP